MNASIPPWHVPVGVEDIAETGQRFDLAPDEPMRAAISRAAGLRDLPDLTASFEVTRYGAGGLHISGQVSATVSQRCVVTLEPLASQVEEMVDLVFMPQPVAAPQAGGPAAAGEAPRELKWDQPEPLVDGQVDLGALATEFLILGLDRYPRKPGAVFQPPQDANPQSGPFTGLAGLKRG